MNYKMSLTERVIYVALFFVFAALCVAFFCDGDSKIAENGDRFSAKNGESYVSSENRQSKLIDINKAGYLELLTLPGIGEKKASAIIEYRSEHGKFGSTEDIMDVPGIGNATYNGFKDMITVGD